MLHHVTAIAGMNTGTGAEKLATRRNVFMFGVATELLFWQLKMKPAGVANVTHSSPRLSYSRAPGSEVRGYLDCILSPRDRRAVLTDAEDAPDQYGLYSARYARW